MAQADKTLRVGMNLEYFEADATEDAREDGSLLDFDAYRRALGGYHRTLDSVGSIDVDNQFKEFISVTQQILGELDGEGEEQALTLLKWYKKSKEPSFGVF